MEAERELCARIGERRAGCMIFAAWRMRIEAGVQGVRLARDAARC